MAAGSEPSTSLRRTQAKPSVQPAPIAAGARLAAIPAAWIHGSVVISSSFARSAAYRHRSGSNKLQSSAGPV